MDSLYAIDEEKKVLHLISIYSQRFKELFAQDPLIDDSDRAALRRLVTKVSGTKEKLALIVSAYLELPDEFVRKSGYKLQFIDGRVNAIIVDHANKDPSCRPSGLIFNISLVAFCDSCLVKTTTIAKSNEVCDYTLICDDCKKIGRKPQFYGNDPVVARQP